VWAVGWSMRLSPHSASTVILRWTGTAWRRLKSPHPGQSGGDELQDVTAIASNIAWAVGDYRDPNTAMDRTLVVHWNGKSWTHVASPTPPLPAHDPFLVGVAATSATNAWAVGEYSSGLENVLILHCNGKAWHRQL